MKICITSSGDNLDSLIDARFGRCLYFIFVDSDNPTHVDVVPNEGVEAMRGAGVQSAQVVVDQRAEAVITGNVGPNAFGVLMSSGVKIYQGLSGMKVREELDLFNKNKLAKIEESGNTFGRGRFRGQRF